MIAGRGNLPAPETLEGSLLLLLIPLLSPQGWDYVFLIGTPAVMLLVNDLRSLPRGLRIATIAAIAVVALSIYDLMGRSAYSLFMQPVGHHGVRARSRSRRSSRSGSARARVR